MGFLVKKRSYAMAILIGLCFTSVFSNFDEVNVPNVKTELAMYDQLKLSEVGLSREIFAKAVAGWKTVIKNNCVKNQQLLSIADLSQSSNSKRLYVIDFLKKKLLFNTYVAHGKNSGEEYANVFSNQPESYKSSLGFYLTENTYSGSHGLSMKLKGLEKGINDNAEERNIVVHGADYVSQQFCLQNGRLGRSQGCPAVPKDLCEPIVNSIKDGSCFFVFFPDSVYLKKSVFVSSKSVLN